MHVHDKFTFQCKVLVATLDSSNQLRVYPLISDDPETIRKDRADYVESHSYNREGRSGNSTKAHKEEIYDISYALFQDMGKVIEQKIEELR